MAPAFKMESGRFLKWGNRSLTWHLLSQSEASSTRAGLYLTELLAKESHGNPQATQAVAQTIDCSPQADSKVPTQLTEYEEGKLV